MAIVTAADAPAFETADALVTGLAAPSRGARETAVWRLRLQPDAPSPRHSLTREEVFVVLEGSVTARFADRQETADAGGALIIPPGEPFSLVAHAAPAEAVCALPVGGMAEVDGETFTPPWAE